MTTRDRTVLIVVVLVAVLGAAWMLLVSPERKQASQLGAQVAAAQASLASAEGKEASARAAQSQYAAAYASVVTLGKAVPPSQEVPALIDELSQASNEKQVNFASITAGGGGGASTPASAAAASTASTASSGGFTQLPFTFTFEGSYFDLEHLFRQLTDFAVLDSSRQLQVSGRLLTIQDVKLSPLTSNTEPAVKRTASNLSGTITATAYMLPSSGGASSSASPGATTAGATTPASSTGAASSPTAPALVRVNP
ncbi:MAG TPA: hypothetical protein VK790_06390 [Solirubrobacteraceae bacterium]|jgi:Tfp pilus assembly protein PilO|nr:hypothetical protein [Solirubrobacteraceae bacterium]